MKICCASDPRPSLTKEDIRALVHTGTRNKKKSCLQHGTVLPPVRSAMTKGHHSCRLDQTPCNGTHKVFPYAARHHTAETFNWYTSVYASKNVLLLLLVRAHGQEKRKSARTKKKRNEPNAYPTMPANNLRNLGIICTT